ncbi:MAG: redoxin domain-containing protein [Clostridia bacterium]|nr:redoxin domain-containing protein [Clostridia bacterium]MBR0406838.1 redoxin domain-containing protein [Clostridia bacterium]
MMKKWAFLFVLLLLACALACGTAENRKNLISPENLHTLVDDSFFVNIIDLRSKEKYDAGHIPQAVSFPLRELKSMIQEIINDGFSVMTSQIIVYGETEQEGIDGAEILVSFGFTNVWRLESMDMWGGALISTEDEMRPLKNLDTIDLYGAQMDESILSGHKLTVINVWATYYSACADEIAALGRIAREMEPQGVQVIGLLSDAVGATFEPDPEVLRAAREILENAQADYVNLVPSKELYIKIIGQITAIPTSFIVDETGMLVGRGYPGAYSYDEWKTNIQEILHQMK